MAQASCTGTLYLSPETTSDDFHFIWQRWDTMVSNSTGSMLWNWAFSAIESTISSMALFAVFLQVPSLSRFTGLPTFLVTHFTGEVRGGASSNGTAGDEDKNKGFFRNVLSSKSAFFDFNVRNFSMVCSMGRRAVASSGQENDSKIDLR